MKIKFSRSFIEGFSRVLDLNGTKGWPKLAGDRRADYEAIRSDWGNVGKTIRGECKNYKRT